MLLSLFPQRGKDIPAASSSGLTTNHAVTLTDTSKPSGAPNAIARATLANLLTYLATLGFKSSSSSVGVGYATGAGGAVTQATNKATGVTLSKVCGAITLNNASLADATTVSFTVTNTTVAATDVVVVNHSSAGTAASYLVWADSIGAGSFKINVRNVSGGSLSEAIVLSFAVIKAVAA